MVTGSGYSDPCLVFHSHCCILGGQGGGVVNYDNNRNWSLACGTSVPNCAVTGVVRNIVKFWEGTKGGKRLI